MGEGHRYGEGRPHVVLVHGGPGACGSLAPLARRLGRRRAVIEPWSTAMTVDGEIEELSAAIRSTGVERTVVIGHSWGAWLATLAAERRPEGIAGLIWIGCPPFTAAEAAAIGPTRMARLSETARVEVEAGLARSSTDPGGIDDAGFARLGRILATADDFDPLPETEEPTALAAVYRAVWPEAAALRASGELGRRLARLRVPVVALHGDHDPHPIEAIARIGAGLAGGFRLHRLADCGHTPWRERRAGERFCEILEAEIDRLLGPAPT